MYPLSWFIPIKKPVFYPHPPYIFRNFAAHIHNNSLMEYFVPIIRYGHRLGRLHLSSCSLLFCAAERLTQFILFRVVYDHVRFSCRIFISLLPQPQPTPTLLACLMFLPPTFLLSVTPHGGVRLFMWLLHAIHAWLPAHNVAGPCYYTRPTLLLPYIQWRAI